MKSLKSVVTVLVNPANISEDKILENLNNYELTMDVYNEDKYLGEVTILLEEDFD